MNEQRDEISESGVDGNSLDGMLLVAMPNMSDPRFAHSVIYLCTFSSEGAMGLIVNQLADTLDFGEIIGQLGIEVREEARSTPVHVGGPVETSRGFVLHSTDYTHPDTLVIDERFALSATVDVLRAISDGSGPKQRVFALGYAGWAPGQLDAEIQSNGWLIVPSDEDIVFGNDQDSKWRKALCKIGVDPSLLSGDSGHA
ncbi:MAG: YqgE/AlgH family protein [Geminicoccaceae bacterium]|nr:YqgE/AlgH family protein [Geminicoccaceae bacterium]